MKERKRIAFVISSLDCGGAQRALANLTKIIPETYDVDLILNDSSHVVYPYKGNIVSLGVNTPENRNNILFQARLLLRRVIKLRQLKKKNNYIATISFLHSANIANVLSGKKYCKTIISVRSNLSRVNKKYNRIIGQIVCISARFFYKRADKVIALSKGVEIDLKTNFGIEASKLETIYNGYDLNSIVESSKEKPEIEICQDAFNFATMGRLTAQKGQWHLIRAFQKVVSTNKNCKLYILGQGELEEYLEKLVSELKLNDNVEMCGFIENPYAVLGRMDAYVFPSLYEGFGNALLEAMALRLPCIVSDYEFGAREILQDVPKESGSCVGLEYLDYGVLFPVPDGKQYYGEELTSEEKYMADAMLKMMSDADLRNKYANRAKQRSNEFAQSNMWGKWEKVING